jgi:hypothetical protein
VGCARVPLRISPILPPSSQCFGSIGELFRSGFAVRLYRGRATGRAERYLRLLVSQSHNRQ